MKRYLFCGILALGAWLLTENVSGQSISDIFKSPAIEKTVTGFTGGKELTMENIEGKWIYTHPAVQLKSDNVLKNAAANVATAELEKKLKEACTKAGIVEGVFDYTFNKDNTFSNTLKGRSLKGTFVIDRDEKTIEFHYAKAGKFNGLKITGHVIISGSSISILFNADKLLDLISKVSSFTNNSTLNTIGKLAEQYTGMMLGFTLKK